MYALVLNREPSRASPPRVSFVAVVALDMLQDTFILLAAVLLSGPLRRTDDLCHFSRDGFYSGAVMLGVPGKLQNPEPQRKK